MCLLVWAWYFRKGGLMKRILVLTSLVLWVFPALVGAQVPEDSLWAVWDTTYLFDPTSLNVETLWVGDTGISGMLFTIGEIRFTSRDFDDEPIRIQAYFADRGADREPAVVVGHGLGGRGSIDQALGAAVLASGLGISISAPGSGDSEGHGPDPENWVSTVPNPANTWICRYVQSAVRAMTYALSLPQVDSAWVGYTGASAGGLMTFLASAIDRRCSFAFPIFACGEWERAVECENSWIAVFFGDSISPDDERIVRLRNYFDPAAYYHWHDVPTFLSIGAQDEFFPIYSLTEFWANYDHHLARLQVAANMDHMVYFGPDPEYSGRYDSFDNSRHYFEIQTTTMTSFWLALKNGWDIPRMPLAEAEYSDGTLHLTAQVDASFALGTVKVWVSVDTGWTFQDYSMHLSPTGEFYADIDLPDGFDLSNTIFFVEVNGGGFDFTSNPYVPIPVKVRPAPSDDAVKEPRLPSGIEVKVSPNPFNSACRITLPDDNRTHLVEIFDLSGRLIRQWAVPHQVGWDGTDMTGESCPSGAYFVVVDRAERIPIALVR